MSHPCTTTTPTTMQTHRHCYCQRNPLLGFGLVLQRHVGLGQHEAIGHVEPRFCERDVL